METKAQATLRKLIVHLAENVYNMHLSDAGDIRKWDLCSLGINGELAQDIVEALKPLDFKIKEKPVEIPQPVPGDTVNFLSEMFRGGPKVHLRGVIIREASLDDKLIFSKDFKTECWVVNATYRDGTFSLVWPKSECF